MPTERDLCRHSLVGIKYLTNVYYMNYLYHKNVLHSDRNLCMLTRPAAKLPLDIVLWHQSTADLVWLRTRAYPDENPLTRAIFVARTCLQETSRYLSEEIF